jgi:hypothetical protein
VNHRDAKKRGGQQFNRGWIQRRHARGGEPAKNASDRRPM